MGGLGSGGWNSSGRPIVEASATLAISALQRRGILSPGASTLWRWSRGSECIASISVRGGIDHVVLSYCVGAQGARAQVAERVEIERRACRFGGTMPLFSCPRCRRSVLKLHLRAGRFACRQCLRLTYASRRERERDRHLRAANKLRARLGGEAAALNCAPERPKGMWRRRYEQIVQEMARRENMAMEELARWLVNAAQPSSGGKRFW